MIIEPHAALNLLLKIPATPPSTLIHHFFLTSALTTTMSASACLCVESRAHWCNATLSAQYDLSTSHVTLQSAISQSRWVNLPVRLPIDATWKALVNSRGARLRGLEIEVRHQSTTRWDVSMGAALTDARYRANVQGTGLDRNTPVYNIPRLSLAGSVRYSCSMQTITIPISIHLHHHSRCQTGLLGNGTSGDPITALNMQLSLESLHGWGAYLHIDNLTNERGAVDGRTARGQAIRLRPRGMEIGLHYQY